MRIEFRALVLALACACAGVCASHAATPRTWDFTVFLDKRQIGSHRFVVTDAAESRTVESTARFQVRILGFEAYHYDHHATENWNAGCLRSLVSRTDSDGKPAQVDAQSSASGLLVTTLTGSSTLPGCISSFAYWDATLPQKRQLLNSQTGDYVAVVISELAAGDTTQRRYHISGAGLDITLGYALAGGDWISLESRLADGRVLRYVRR